MSGDDRDRQRVLESTQVEAHAVETIDALGPTARARRREHQDPAARAKILAQEALSRDRAKIGRYQLLEVVGRGGMGVVWGAWDPELERRVALKLLRPTLGSARTRIVGEGQALAKLSHPNVVPVYDVGVMGEEVYLVMEWIRGTTLRAYADDKPPRSALLDAYAQAGEGLAAAHRAGVIHRDFKPDNAIRGDDGRVRVLDFGLAYDIADGPVKVAGTPRYMAPEQLRGDPLTAAVDQFAFCRALEEALTDPPRWIRELVERGLADDPAARFASMDELLAALARDPWRRRRRAALAAGIVISASVAFVVGRRGAEADAVEPCTSAPDEIAASWSSDTRARVTSHLASAGAMQDTEVARLANELDGYRNAWTAEHRRACLAHASSALTPRLYEARLGCLARARAALGATGELLANVAPAGLPPALVAAHSLPDTHACGEMDDSRIEPPPPALAPTVAAIEPRIERALVLATAAQESALPAATAALASARATGYTPLIARALLAKGRAEMVFAPQTAAATLTEASTLGLRAFDDPLAVEAYARWMYVSRDTRPGEGWAMMNEIAGRSDQHGRFAHALLYNNRGVVRLAMGDRTGAARDLRIASDLAEGTTEIELAWIGANRALVEAPAERERYARQASARFATTLGATHPATLGTRTIAALLSRDRAGTQRELREICRAYAPWNVPTRGGDCAFEAAWLADEVGDEPSAKEWLQAAAANADYAPFATAYLQNDRISELENLAVSKGASTQWWDRAIAARAYVAIARTRDRIDSVAGERAWAAAAALLERIDNPIYERPLAHVRAVLAVRRAARDPTAARELARDALAWYHNTVGYEAVIARLEPIAR